MRKITQLIAFFLLLSINALLVNPAFAESVPTTEQFVDHLIIKLKSNSAEKEVLNTIDGELAERLSKNMLLVKVTNFTVEQAQKILDERQDVEYSTPDYYLKQSVDKAISSHVGLWNNSAQSNASVAAVLQSINNRSPETKVAFIDFIDRSDEINANKKEISTVDLSENIPPAKLSDYDEVFFHYAILSDRQNNANISDLIRALSWIYSTKATMAGINLYSENYSPALKEIMDKAIENRLTIVHFRNKSNKIDQQFSDYYKQQMVDVVIEVKNQNPKEPTVTPNLYPVPTIPVAASGLTFNLPTLEVDSMSIKLVQTSESKDIKIAVKIKGTHNDQIISGAKIIVDLTTPSGKIFTGNDLTNSVGECEFILRNITNPGRYTVRITGLEKSGYTISTGFNSSSTIDIN